MKKKWFELGMGIFILAASFILGSAGGKMTAVNTMAEVAGGNDKVIIALDPGHGGSDPGKVGINQALEKELNLSISKKVQKILESNQVSVAMTRETDEGLYDAGSSNKKQQDMKKRCELIDNSNAKFTVSIHQNSYSEESVHGPQVFYFSQSEDGKKIAETIQAELNTGLQVDRPRDIKANDSYYLLKKTKNPTVIVECGFLSNQAEASKLITEEYQQQVADSVARGILNYIAQLKNSESKI